MQLSVIKGALTRALEKTQAVVCAHIGKVESEGRTTAIEAAFAKLFEAELPTAKLLKEQSLKIIQTKTFYERRESGRIDCFLADKGVAFEYKAVRLPRRTSDSIGGAQYDIGQLSSDYLRLSRAKKLNAGYIVAFVYGPLVADAASAGKLYRAFHNQMFVDFRVAAEHGQIDGRKIARRAYRELGWDAARGEGKTPDGITVVKVGALGAICIDCGRLARSTG